MGSAYHYEAFSIRSLAARAVIEECWQRLPLAVRARLAGVTITVDPALKSMGDAGQADVRLRDLPWDHAAALGLVCHELAHVYGNDHMRRCAGVTETQVEDDCDGRLVQWGFSRELAALRRFGSRGEE